MITDNTDDIYIYFIILWRMGFISGFVGINMEIIACITYNQKLELPSGVIKRGWPRNPRAKWRFVAGKISINLEGKWDGLSALWMGL